MTATSRTARRSRPVLLLLAVVTALLGALLATGTTAPAQAAGYDSIAGSGSTWSQIMIDQWVRDVKKNGLPVSYTGNGSSAGRSDYWNNLNDFAVSEIPFQPRIPGSSDTDELSIAAKRPYAYLPIVAGGTSFMYHLTVGGKRVENLRLSGETLTKIFTGVINKWSDPAISKDNSGRVFPAKTITPILRSDGSGTSAQFTLFMSRRYPSLWTDFCRKYNSFNGNCGLQSFYPPFPGAKGQALSSGVANYVAAPYGEGAITYVEYSYAQRAGYPVASILNAGGYYVQPTAGNVAVALTKAGINSDLTQNLDGVYAFTDPRTYPVSSYSYMIVPTAIAGRFTTGKGRTLTTFMSYFLCAGQQKAAALGFSPLPTVLVQRGFQQLARVPGHIAAPALASCNNPALSILQSAPQPAACQKATSLPCGTSTVTGAGGQGGGGSGGGSRTGSGGGGSGGSGGAAGGTGSGGTAGSGGTGGGSGGGGSGTAAGGSGLASGSGSGAGGTSGSGSAVDPVTGEPVGTTGGTGDTASGTDISATPVSVSGLRQGGGQANVLYVLAGVELVLALFVPPLMSGWLRRRRSSS